MIKDFFGTDTFYPFLIQLWWAGIGIIVSLLWHAATRDASAPSTPYKFDFLFLLKDNWKRILLSCLEVYIVLVFFKEFTGLELSRFWCLAIGLSLDKISQLIKDKTGVLWVKR
jgi:hypothetical protein